MKTKFLFLIPLAVLSLLVSCNEIFETDISDEKVNLISPADSVTLIDSKQTFWWEELDEALSYNLVIASPSFDEAMVIDLDTVLTNTKVDFNLLSISDSAHQWTVIARNGDSRSDSVIRTFFTTSEVSIRNERVVPTSPSSGSIVTDSIFDLSWDPLPGAEYYEVRWQTELPFSNISPVEEVCCRLRRENLTVGETYFWSVRAIGEGESNRSEWSSPWSVTIESP